MLKYKVLFALAVMQIAIIMSSCTDNREIKPGFCHHVYFWLNNPDDPADREAFEEGIAGLIKIPEIKLYHLGVPVRETAGRSVVDGSYTYSYMVFFDDLAGHDVYQDHPLHVKFVEECKHLWNKVLVYDSEVQ